ncbi:MAG: D-3-phosphoglycerate dehydrogenase, partial [Chloroflexota bacterium]|nr:D-3-phosphoglycerate dehydrogenase [Chloroflexota bacterium]
SGWGCPTLDKELLDAAPNLKIVFYGAGSIRAFTPDEFWARGITICSAWGANAVPVSEYALAAILFGLKSVWQNAAAVRQARSFQRQPSAGAYGSTVGLVSLGMVGRLVMNRLKTFEVTVIAYDPFVTAEQGAALGVELVGLDDIFRRGDVVSVHTPWLPETVGLITGAHIASMKPYATFVNTSRGAVIREGEMIEALAARPDLWAVLDVTYPEPPPADSPLYTLPNVLLTPHIAGSVGEECHRQARYMIEELERYLAGQPLKWAVSKERAAIMA